MAVELTPDLSRELEVVDGRPLQVVVPLTQKVYVIVTGDLFDRLRPLFDEDEFDSAKPTGHNRRLWQTSERIPNWTPTTITIPAVNRHEAETR